MARERLRTRRTAQDSPKQAQVSTKLTIHRQTQTERRTRPRATGVTKRLSTVSTCTEIGQTCSVLNRDERSKQSTTPARVEPDRKWFGNTRSIDQKTLDNFRREIENETHNTYSLLLKKRKLPASLVNPLAQGSFENKLIDKFEDTFGKKARRTKPTLSVFTLEELSKQSEEQQAKYDSSKDRLIEGVEKLKEAESKYITAGQSKRIYNELHKVIDSSDVIVQVLDARDPVGTRSSYVENFVKKNCPHKHIIIVLNKSDLIPNWCTIAWIKLLSKEYPTLAFHASITNPFGMSALFQLLRQFDALHHDKKNISVGFIGYPNVGKSSIINTLRKKNVCKAAPVPGETKVWQYVTLTKRIYLIDCPGVVYNKGDSDSDIVLKNVVRAEKLEDPSSHIHELLKRVRKEYIQQIYGIDKWQDSEDFLGLLGIKGGRLLKGGEPDIETVARMLLFDWQKGKIPYFLSPPKREGEDEELKIKQDFNDLVKNCKFVKEDLEEAHQSI